MLSECMQAWATEIQRLHTLLGSHEQRTGVSFFRLSCCIVPFWFDMSKILCASQASGLSPSAKDEVKVCTQKTW